MSTVLAGSLTPITTEVNTDNDPAVRNKPTLTKLQVTYFPALTDGFTFRFQVQVFTIGSRNAFSDIAWITKGAVPEKPIDRPVSDSSVTSDTTIKVTYASPAPANGGVPILSYELQMDDGLAGAFTSLTGFSTNSMATTHTVTKGVVRGRTHRLRYRALNLIGWGPFSEEQGVLAARVPDAPLQPLYQSFVGSVMNIVIQPSPDHGGASISKYELWVDSGNDFTSSFTQMSLYLGTTMTYGISPLDNLVRGRIYRFKTRAINVVGASDFSIISYIAYGDVPAAPSAPTQVSTTRTSITVAWLPPASSDLAVKGYVLSMDDGINGEFKPIFIGTNRPDVLTYQVGDLITGRPYRFYVQAMDENGISLPSPISTFFSCTQPNKIDTPVYVSSF